MTVQERHSVVVGGTHGIGRSVVRRFASEGGRVSIVGRRQPPEADLPGVRLWQLDLGDTAAIPGAVEEIVKWGGPVCDLVFLQRARDGDDEWRREIEVTLEATRDVIEALRGTYAESASIVVVSSSAGRLVAGEQPLSYHVGKAGMSQMARWYAVSLGREGVRVNVVLPSGIVKEEARDWYADNPSVPDRFRALAPLGRMGTPEDVAGVVAFLCGPDAAYVTGQEIAVDGGVSVLLQESLVRGSAQERKP